MKTLTICLAMFLATGAMTWTRAAAVAPAAAQFCTQFRLTAIKDGRRIVLAEPSLVTEDGRAATFLAGGEVKMDFDGTELVPYGVKARVKVRQRAADQLDVWMYVVVGDLDARSESDFVIREQGVRCVKTIKPGEQIEIDLGDGRTATFTVTALPRT